jgi:hypothetical protein
MSNLKIWALRFSASILGVFAFILLLEAILTVTHFNTKSYVRFVPGMGSVYIPHAYYRHTKEGFSEGYFNSHGFRDYERTYAKPKGTFRILVLGDSYTEGLQVALENTFPALLETKLNEDFSPMKFEVLNLGQSGFGTADAYIRYLNVGIQFSPDLIILAFLTGNDFHDNSRNLDRDEIRVYFTLDKAGNLVLDRSLIDGYERSLTLPKRIFQFVKYKSHLASLISERLYLLRYQLKERRFERRLASDKQDSDRQILPELSDLNIYLADMSDRWREAFAITERLLLEFQQKTKEQGGQFILVTLSNAEQLVPEIQQRLNEKYKVSFDFDQPDRVIENFARRTGITHLKLMPIFRNYHIKTGIYLHGFGSSHMGHWNEAGHRLAAEKIYEFFEENHLVPKRNIENKS